MIKGYRKIYSIDLVTLMGMFSKSLLSAQSIGFVKFERTDISKPQISLVKVLIKTTVDRYNII